MAYNSGNPPDDGFLLDAPAQLRENFRALKDDAIVNAATLNGLNPYRLKFKVKKFISSGTWSCPSDITEVLITMCGGGGGGGGHGNDGEFWGTGGQSGEFIYRVIQAVTPGSLYTITIGAGGAAGTNGGAGAAGGNGGNGETTSFKLGGTTIIDVDGGSGGAGASASAHAATKAQQVLLLGAPSPLGSSTRGFFEYTQLGGMHGGGGHGSAGTVQIIKSGSTITLNSVLAGCDGVVVLEY